MEWRRRYVTAQRQPNVSSHEDPSQLPNAGPVAPDRTPPSQAAPGPNSQIPSITNMKLGADYGLGSDNGRGFREQ